ncbi:MAG: hypothetical protein HQ591_03015 [candidate division Zixibacteria bacterium]|nr:hypothetical protein [Candidatus Tariuqbacter arcticus]
MPKQKASEVAIDLFDSSIYPNGLTEGSAWLGFYQTLIWFEESLSEGVPPLLHIIDSDKLRPAVSLDMKYSQKSKIWVHRARMVAEYLAKELNVSIDDLPNKVGRLFNHPNWKGRQKNNPLGIGLVALVSHCLRKFSADEFDFQIECHANSIFPDIRIPGRSKDPRIDILAHFDGIPRAIVSCKWSVRHDRLGDITSECTVYKAEALRSRLKLDYYLITNEYDPARLSKILDDSCIDNVVHVHKHAVVDVCGLDDRLIKLLDLSVFLKKFK